MLVHLSEYLARVLNGSSHFSRQELNGRASRKRRWTFPTLLLTIAVLMFAPALDAKASSPASGTLDPAATAPVTWGGTATGPAAPSLPSFAGVPGLLPSCVEGVNCDSFLLNIAGTTDDWTGKVARIRIDWLLPTTDYDLYVLRDTPDRAYIIAESKHNLPGSATTHEITDLSPSFNGTGQYRVLVVYTTATAADQYAASASVVAIPAGSPCGVPGEAVLTDIIGDPKDAQPAHDIDTIYIGEPASAGPDSLVFTMKVRDLNWLSPNSAWRVYFRTPNVAGQQYFVDMRTDLFGAVRYKYGTGETTLGDADAGSYDPQNGTIRITVSTSKIGSPMPNQYPPQKLEQIYMFVSVGSVIVDSAPSRDVVLSQASYTVVGNDACQ